MTRLRLRTTDRSHPTGGALRRGAATVLAVLALGGLTGGMAAPAQAATLTVACGSVGQDYEFCKRHAEAWAKKTGHSVKFFAQPNSASDVLALLRQVLGAKSADIDVMTLDIVWPGVLKDHLIDLKPYSKGAEAGHFPAIVQNNLKDGKLLAMPWFTDAGLLYYRKDLLDKYGLQAPTTWAAMAVAAQKIQDGERAAGQADFQGYVFQGKAYEGLSCNALEWVVSHGGGVVVDASGQVTVNQPATVQAFKTAASWMGKITSTGVLNYGEEEARGVFQSGKAAFMRNWPYAWALANGADSPIKGKIGVSPLPHGGSPGMQPAATLGGSQLAVSKYSKAPVEAANLVMYLTSAEVQKDRAIRGAYNPTLTALYDDKDVLAAHPFFGNLRAIFENAVPRPSTVTGAKYPEVSAAFWNAAHDTLSGKVSAQDSVKRLEGRLNQIKRGQW